MQNAPGNAPSEHRESTQESLETSVQALRTTVGIPQPPLQPNMTREQLKGRALELAKDNVVADAHEMFEWGKLRNTVTSIDGQAALEDSKKRPQLDMAEFTAVRDGVTYAEYLAKILEHTTATTERYMALKKSVKIVPPSVLQQEPKLQLFTQTLKQQTQQRLLFANAVLISMQLRSQKDLQGAAQQNQGQLLQRLEKDIKPKLDTASLADLATGDVVTLQKRMNQLDQQIVETIGKDGQLPNEMLLALLSQAFEESVEREQTATRGVMPAAEKRRFTVLRNKNDAAAAGKGEPLNDQEKLEYERLTRLNDDARGDGEPIRAERKKLTLELHETLDGMADFHVDMAALTTIRHQFKGPELLDGAQDLPIAKTPDDVRKKMNEVMQLRKQFHLARLDQYGERFESEVLTVGWKEITEDFSNTSGREFVRILSNQVATLYTLPVPEALGMKAAAQKALAGPLQEALGWPSDQLDVKFEELDQATRDKIMEKMTSIKTLVEQFDKSKIARFRESIAVLRNLPAPTEAEMGASIQDPLPTERVTQQNMKALVEKHGLATVYVMATRQLDADWDGGAEGGKEGGFLAEQRKFFDGVNKNLDTHFDVASALFEQSNMWKYVMYGILAVTGSGIALKLWMRWRTRSLAAENARLLKENEALKRAYNSAGNDRAGLRRNLDRSQELAESRGRALSETTKELDKVRLLAHNQERLLNLQKRATELSLEFDEALKIKDLAARKVALDTCVQKAKAFQGDLNLLDSVMPGARQAVARQVFAMEKLTLSDDAWKVLEEMHSIQRAGNAATDVAETGLYFRVSAENTLKMERLMAASHLAPAEVRVLKKLMRMGVAGQSSTMIRSGVNAGLREARLLEQAARVSHGLHWTQALPVIAVAVDGYIVRQDIYALADAINYPDEVRSQLHTALTHPAAGFEYDAKTETYTKGPMKLHVHADVLKTLSASKMDAAKGRLTNDITAGALGTSAMFMESGVGIPIGLLIAAGAITVDMNIHAGERKVALDFVEKSEPWLLAYMGTSITGFDEGDLLYSGLYDLFAEDANIEHREKIMFALFAHCLKKDPKLMRRITGGDFSPESLNAFYAGDFKKFVLPAFSMALFGAQSGKYAEGSAPFSEAKSYRFQSERIQAPNAEPKDVYYACLKALEKYEEKLLEERFVSVSRELETAAAEGRYDDALLYDDMLRSLGGETVLGKTLFEVSDELLAHDKKLRAHSPNARPETRMDAVLQAYYGKLSGAGKLAYQDMVTQEFTKDGSSPLTLKASEVQWDGASIPPLLRLRGGVVREASATQTGNGLFGSPRYTQGEMKTRDDSQYHRFFDLRTSRSSDKTGSMLSKVDPDMHARMFREQMQDLQPYERLNVARKTPGVFVEIGQHEDGLKIFGCSTDGDQVTLMGVRGNDVYFKTVQKTGPEPAWQIVRGGGKFADQLDLPADKRSEAVRTILPLLALPNAYDDEESVRRGIMLYTDLPNPEPLVKQLALMLGTIPSGELDSRKEFLRDLQRGCDREGMIRHARGVRNIIAEVLLPRAKRGAYGESAKVRMPAVENLLR